MKRILLYIFISFTISTSLIAQNDYREAYIINNSSDTINGFIYYSSISKLENKIFFKKSIKQKDYRELSPKEINSFTLKKYNEKFVSISKSSKSLIFANKIVSGQLNLYRTKNYYYLENEEYGINSLYVLSDSRKISKEKQVQKNFGKLTLYTKDCEKFKSKINEKSFYLKELTNIVKEYNNCKSPNTIDNSKNKKINKPSYKLGLNIYTSLNYTNLKIVEYPEFIDNSSVSSSGITPTIGLEIRNSFPNLSEYFSFVLGVGIGKEEYLFQNVNNFSGGYLIRTKTLTSNYTYLEVPLFISSYFNIKDTKLNLDIGVSNKIRISSNHSKSEQNEYNTKGEYFYEVIPFDSDYYKNTIFLLIQTGIVIPKGFIPESELKLVYKFSLNSSYTARYTQRMFGVNYSIKLF